MVSLFNTEIASIRNVKKYFFPSLTIRPLNDFQNHFYLSNFMSFQNKCQRKLDHNLRNIS